MTDGGQPGPEQPEDPWAQQPYGGQPYPGQPYGGQPYPGQPYPGQPYPGQPYPGQPYPGQPYPGQPYGGQPPYGGFPAPPGAYGMVPYGAPVLPLPPGVQIASAGRRIGAYFLAFPLWIVTLLIGYLVWGAVLWGKGTSPALRLLGMRCVDSRTGQPVGWGTMALRDIIGGFVQSLFGVVALVSFILFLVDETRHQTLADKIGSTVVVYDPDKVLG